MTDSRTPGANGARSRPSTAPAPKKKSLVHLLGELPQLVSELVRSEIELVKTELIGKLKALGIGGALFAVAAVILLFMIGVLLTSAVLALGQVMPPWLAALVVAAVLLIAAVIVALIGWRVMKAGIPPVPTEAIDSLQSDLRAIKGTGRFRRSAMTARHDDDPREAGARTRDHDLRSDPRGER